MQLTLSQAATLMGISPRTLRDRLARGQVPGTKRGGRWYVDSHGMPLSEPQRLAMQARADEIRSVVEAALPSRTATTRARRSRSLADLDAFRQARAVAAAIRSGLADPASSRPGAREALAAIDAALLDLAEGAHAFDRETKLAAFRMARRGFSRAVGLLLREADDVPADPVVRWVVELESRVLASLAGLLRWTENLGAKP